MAHNQSGAVYKVQSVRVYLPARCGAVHLAAASRLSRLYCRHVHIL